MAQAVAVSGHPDARSTRSLRVLRALAWAGAGLALAAVFAAYQDPQLVFDLASRAWACF
jgi:hypothetical protein